MVQLELEAAHLCFRCVTTQTPFPIMLSSMLRDQAPWFLMAVSPASHSSSSGPGQKEPPRKASPRKSLHHRKRIEIESDGSAEETDSSEN
ncbi:hypothetical protein SKAU_G00244670 [Synaphobranchus kaupii]|uniref:Uncharacterized protein n=1 Tax=Synaphobranchus kaupii TaxID=118154 RepID=A0A9Q1F225_SYNKA|nr:hypothetical protein SKAU_G00244670 [Synaphobranchus kaupii]